MFVLGRVLRFDLQHRGWGKCWWLQLSHSCSVLDVCMWCSQCVLGGGGGGNMCSHEGPLGQAAAEAVGCVLIVCVGGDRHTPQAAPCWMVSQPVLTLLAPWWTTASGLLTLQLQVCCI
jgi:hypothetical protein